MSTPITIQWNDPVAIPNYYLGEILRRQSSLNTVSQSGLSSAMIEQEEDKLVSLSLTDLMKLAKAGSQDLIEIKRDYK